MFADPHSFHFVLRSVLLQVTKYLVIRDDGSQRWVLEVSPQTLDSFTHPSPLPHLLFHHATLLKSTVRRLLASRSKSSTRRSVIPFRQDVFAFLFGQQSPGRKLELFPPTKFPTPYFDPSFLSYTSAAGTLYYGEIYLRFRLSVSSPNFTESPNAPNCFIPVPYSEIFTECLSVRVDRKV